jgi:uncharacterized protein (DUF3084 family)
MNTSSKIPPYQQNYANMQTELRFLSNQIRSIIDQNPTLPNANNLDKMLGFILKLSHSFFDLQMHNAGLLEENRELYRQLELSSTENEARFEEIANLQAELQQWQDYSNHNVDLFTEVQTAEKQKKGFILPNHSSNDKLL